MLLSFIFYFYSQWLQYSTMSSIDDKVNRGNKPAKMTAGCKLGYSCNAKDCQATHPWGHFLRVGTIPGEPLFLIFF